MQQHLVDITTSIQKCFSPGSAQFNTLAKYSKKLVQKREKWPEKIFLTWQNRKVPVYSPESITKCNQARVSQIEFATQEQALCDELHSLEGEMAPIRTVSTQSNQKHLVVPKGNSIVGWLPWRRFLCYDPTDKGSISR